MRISHLLLCAFALLSMRASTAQPPPSRKVLKNAAHEIYISDCGNYMNHPESRAKAMLLYEAGDAIVPVLVELLSESQTPAWFTGAACSEVLDFPFSPAFREAVRARRDDPYFGKNRYSLQNVFAYFAKFGDASDLAWMELAAPRFCEASDQSDVMVYIRGNLSALIKEARDRLFVK